MELKSVRSAQIVSQRMPRQQLFDGGEKRVFAVGEDLCECRLRRVRNGLRRRSPDTWVCKDDAHHGAHDLHGYSFHLQPSRLTQSYLVASVAFSAATFFCTACTAAYASTRPCPTISLGSVKPSTSRRAVFFNASVTSRTYAQGCSSNRCGGGAALRISAATPETSGDAIEVPATKSSLIPGMYVGTIANTSAEGTPTDICGPGMVCSHGRKVAPLCATPPTNNTSWSNERYMPSCGRRPHWARGMFPAEVEMTTFFA